MYRLSSCSMGLYLLSDTLKESFSLYNRKLRGLTGHLITILVQNLSKPTLYLSFKLLCIILGGIPYCLSVIFLSTP